MGGKYTISQKEKNNNNHNNKGRNCLFKRPISKN